MVLNTYYTQHSVVFSVKNATLASTAIRFRMTVNGIRFSYQLPSEYKINPKHWDKDAGRAIEDSKRNPDLRGNPHLGIILRNINQEIEKTINALILVVEGYKRENIRANAEQIRTALKKELNRIQEEKPNFTDFISYMDYYLTKCESGEVLNSKGQNLAKSTIKSYKSTRNIVQRYTKAKRINLQLDAVDIEFYEGFIKYLHEIKHAGGSYRPNVIGKFIKNIKVFLNHAYDRGLTKNEDFKKREFRAFREETDTVYLSDKELEVLYALDLPSNQREVRDSFVLGCDTGLRFGDIAELSDRHIDKINNQIVIITQKTANKVVIPISGRVQEILERYDYNPPVQSNQATNRMLKRICKEAKIDNTITRLETKGGVRQETSYKKWELISTHTARRSFATNAFKENVPTLSIMQITGHKTESSFMRYIRISKEENAKLLTNHTFFR